MPSKLRIVSRRVIVVLAGLTPAAVVAVVLPAYLESQHAARSDFYQQWLADKKPFLDSATSVPSTSVTWQVVRHGRHGPGAPEITYIVPVPSESCLLVAKFRLQVASSRVPTGVEHSSYSCLKLAGTRLIERDDRQWRSYSGIPLDESSFADCVLAAFDGDFVDDVRCQLAENSSSMDEWDVQHDPYAAYVFSDDK